MHFGNGPVLAPRNAKFGLASSRPSFQLEIIRTHFQNTARDTIGEERGQRKGKNAKAKTCSFISLSLRSYTSHLDFGKLAQLTCLRRLQLRAACGGLTLPSFAFSGGLAALSNLKDLTKLVTLSTQALHVLNSS